MSRFKSLLARATVDRARRAHDCQHDRRHRLAQGDRRLKVSADRTNEHFCGACAREMIRADIKRLEALARDLDAE